MKECERFKICKAAKEKEYNNKETDTLILNC